MNNLRHTKVLFIACRVWCWISLKCEAVPTMVGIGESTRTQTGEDKCWTEKWTNRAMNKQPARLSVHGRNAPTRYREYDSGPSRSLQDQRSKRPVT